MTEMDINVPRVRIEPLEVNMIGNNGKWKKTMRTVKSETIVHSQGHKENWINCGSKRDWQQVGEEGELQTVENQKKKGRQISEQLDPNSEMVEEASPKWPQVIK